MDRNSRSHLDARPSDAIAIALRFGALIYVDDKVFKKFKQMNGDIEIFDTSEEGKKWAEYLKNLKPEDFSKYKKFVRDGIKHTRRNYYSKLREKTLEKTN